MNDYYNLSKGIAPSIFLLTYNYIAQEIVRSQNKDGQVVVV